MHIIIDRTLHDTCKLIETTSLHRKDNPGCLRAASTHNTWFFTLYILAQRQCDYIGGGVLTLGLLTHHVATTFTFQLIPHILTIPILSPFLFIPSLHASFLKLVGLFSYLYKTG